MEVALLLATQNVSQLDKLYGHHGARIILDQCGTKVSFRQSDAEIAKRMSSFFGQREFRETQEGLSYGAHEMRDGKHRTHKSNHISNTDFKFT